MPRSKLVNNEPVCVPPNTTVQTAAQRVRDEDIGQVTQPCR
jgi:hypothetical protein